MSIIGIIVEFSFIVGHTSFQGIVLDTENREQLRKYANDIMYDTKEDF